jgi:hypothetical protein
MLAMVKIEGVCGNVRLKCVFGIGQSRKFESHG